MDGDRPSAEPPAPPEEARSPELIQARAAVEWQFGELVERVATDHPVTRRRLAWTLAEVEHEAQRRELQHRSDDCLSEYEAPGAILRLPGGTWQLLEQAQGLSDAESVAARDVHRRMAEAVAGDRNPDPGADLFVLCDGAHTD
jgi:hypothetical protein